MSCAGEIGAFLARSIVGRRRGRGPGVSPLVLLRFWRTVVTCDTYPSAYAYRHGCRVRAAGAHCRLASGPGRGDSFQKTGLRSRRHHQHHGPFVPDPAQEPETPDPVRSDAVDSRFHGVRHQANLHDQHQLLRHTVLVVLAVLM